MPDLVICTESIRHSPTLLTRQVGQKWLNALQDEELLIEADSRWGELRRPKQIRRIVLCVTPGTTPKEINMSIQFLTNTTKQTTTMRKIATYLRSVGVIDGVMTRFPEQRIPLNTKEEQLTWIRRHLGDSGRQILYTDNIDWWQRRLAGVTSRRHESLAQRRQTVAAWRKGVLITNIDLELPIQTFAVSQGLPLNNSNTWYLNPDDVADARIMDIVISDKHLVTSEVNSSLGEEMTDADNKKWLKNGLKSNNGILRETLTDRKSIYKTIPSVIKHDVLD